MGNLEFGFDTGADYMNELSVARSKIDQRALDNAHRYFNIPVSYDDVVTCFEDFYSRLALKTPSLAARLFRLDQFRRTVYGFDSVTNVQSLPDMGVTLNDYELHLVHNMSGNAFRIVDLKKDNRADSFLMVNLVAAGNIMRMYSGDFDEIAQANPMTYIEREIAKPLMQGKEPDKTLQHGLLGGIPRNSARLYDAFDGIRKQFPRLSEVYRKFFAGEASSNDVHRVIHDLPVLPHDRQFLLAILAEHARFNNREAITAGSFIMMTTEDLHYAQHREQWLHYLDSVYKPIVLKAQEY